LSLPIRPPPRCSRAPSLPETLAPLGVAEAPPVGGSDAARRGVEAWRAGWRSAPLIRLVDWAPRPLLLLLG